MTTDLIKLVSDRYFTKEETMYRLPMKMDIDAFWEEEMAYRMENANQLPLFSYGGQQYFFVETETFIEAADIITAMARNTSDTSVFAEAYEDSFIEEAYYSSAIEGAYSTRENAKKLIESGRTPADKHEYMIYNNYQALKFMMEHIDEPISEDLICEIGRILTDDTLDEGVQAGYRDDSVYVVSQTGKTIYTAPDPQYIKHMMEQLIEFVNNSKVHPIIKAVISHVYFVTIHPFFDGNGRTARALTYMILIKAGYDFFKMVPISGLLSEERAAYYKSLKASQDTENGYDFTYFAEYYTGLLARTLKSVKNKLQALEQYKKLLTKLDENKDARALKGAYWMANKQIQTITAEKWKQKFSVSFETARKDLFLLEKEGFLVRRKEGRKLFFDRAN